MKIYIDSSVIGGMFDVEFSDVTHLFFSQAKDNNFNIVVSTVIEKEIEGAPKRVKDFFIKEKKKIYNSIGW